MDITVLEAKSFHSESQKQVNSAIVDEILFKYSKQYRKEVKEYSKKLRD